MLINLNIRFTFTLSTGQRFTIDSAQARASNGIVPHLTVSSTSVAGLTPIVQISVANLPPHALSELSLITNNTEVVIDAGYNGNYSLFAVGIINTFPITDSQDTFWTWNARVTAYINIINEIDYTRDFLPSQTWGEFIRGTFEPRFTVIIPEDVEVMQIGGQGIGLNVNSFQALQSHLFARGWSLNNRGNTITFTNRFSNARPLVSIRPEQIKPNQYLDFQSNGDAELKLAGWIPNVVSNIYLNLVDQQSVTILGTATGFSGTLHVFKSNVALSTIDHPIHNITLRALNNEQSNAT